jgi:hypothetical protein
MIHGSAIDARGVRRGWRGLYAMTREKKYRLDTKREVIAAVGLFGMHCRRYPVARRRTAARRIAREARRRGVKIGKNTAVARYARG